MRSRLCSSTRWRYRRGRGIERIDGHYVSTHPAAICTQRKRTCSPTPCPAWATGPGIYHYAPKEHALERRSLIDPSTWSRLLEPFPRGAMLIGLTSIPWRESWKYGERAYRYCQHDAGHAVAALRIAAAILGLLPRVSDQQIEKLLGLDRADAWHTREPELPDALAVIVPSHDYFEAESYQPSDDAIEAAKSAQWMGHANRLSQEHHAWPVIAQVERACRKPVGWPVGWRGVSVAKVRNIKQATDRVTAAQIVRQRRSALAMDGTTSVSVDQLYNTLTRVMPDMTPIPWDAQPWPTCVHLVLFVHRVDDLLPGLYVLVRSSEDKSALRRAMKADFQWLKPARLPQRSTLLSVG